MHVLELAKLPQEQKNETDLMQWMRFLGGKCREDFKKMAEKKEEFAEAYKELDRLSADEKKRLLYEARQKAIRDRDILITTGREQGREEERDRINQLNIQLAENNRIEDILKSATDIQYQQQLLKEFDL